MEKKKIRILSIGNSYSADQQAYVHPMAEAAGADITVGIVYFGSCSFRQHWDFYQSDAPIYKYYENGRVAATEQTMRGIFARHDWDFINFQRGTEKKNYIFPNEPYLSDLVGLVRGLFPRAELIYSQSWTDAETSVRAIFRDAYGCSREYQWEKMLEGVEDAKKTCGIGLVMPCGLAMQAAYGEFGPRMHRDGFHSSELGRYLHACVWFEFFTGLPVPADYLPAGSYKNGTPPTAEECAALREYAHRALADHIAAGEKTPALFV